MSTHRLSLNTATTRSWTLAEALDGAAEAGIEAVGVWRDRVAEAGLDRAAQLIRERGLRVSSLCRGGFLTAADSAGITRALDDNKAAIREAATLGTHELIMVVGGLPAATGAEQPAAPAGDRNLVSARQRVVDRLGDLVSFAQEHGVRLALEPLHPLFAADRAVLNTLGQCLDVAALFPSDAVGVVIDTYHVWWDPDLGRSIARAGREGRISSYQVCDWILPLASTALHSRGHVGDGYIDFPSITEAVIAAGYAGDVEVEIFNQGVWDAPGAETLATVKERHERLIEPHLSGQSGAAREAPNR